MAVKTRKRTRARLGMADKALLYVAMNTGSPTGLFRDSAGYTMLQQKTYATQLAAAKAMDEALLAGAKQRR